MDLVGDRLRKRADNSWLPGLHALNAADGGTGSGLACLMLERLAADHGKESILRKLILQIFGKLILQILGKLILQILGKLILQIAWKIMELANSVEDHEALEASEVVRELSDAVPDEDHDPCRS